MSGLAKILMVIATVLSVFLSALVIAYAANTDRIRTDYESALQAKQAAEASLTAGSAQWQTEQAELRNTITALESKIASKDENIANLQLDMANLQTERAKAQTDRDSVIAKIKDLSDQIKVANTLLTSNNDELRMLRANELNYRTQLAALEDRLSDALSRNEVQDQTIRALRESLASAQQQVASSATAVPASTPGSTGARSEPFEANALISGRVDEVRNDAGANKTLVKLTCGTNNGVSENMKFYVVRDGNWIANLVVRNTDLQYAVAETTLGGSVRAGDMVVSRLR